MSAMDSNPINNTLWRRLFITAVVNLTSRKGLNRLVKRSGNVVFFSNLCIKCSSLSPLTEANTIQFVGRNTTIPVPEIFCSFTRGKRKYIAMQRVRGRNLAQCWSSLSEESRQLILSQLKAMIEELRQIAPPKPDVGISNIDGGAIYDCRLPGECYWGPFKTLRDFNLQLRNGITYESLGSLQGVVSQEAFKDLQDLISFQDESDCSPVFTHGDLSSLNVLVHNDKVVAIVDWETAGWLPYYWEYTNAWHVNPQNLFWQQEVDRFLQQYPFELRMEKVRRTYFGDY